MNEMGKLVLMTGAIMAMLAVVTGAFGAHGLKKILDEDMLTVYKTAVDYHFIHAVGLLIIGVLMKQFPQAGLLSWSAWVMFTGILLFSGSLYALSITGISKLGMITPVGGLLFIIGWLLLAIGIYR